MRIKEYDRVTELNANDKLLLENKEGNVKVIPIKDFLTKAGVDTSNINWPVEPGFYDANDNLVKSYAAFENEGMCGFIPYYLNGTYFDVFESSNNCKCWYLQASGKNFLNNNNITKIIFPKEVGTEYFILEPRTFYNNTKLKHIELPDNMVYLGSPVKNASWGSGQFEGCSNLEYVKLPDKLIGFGCDYTFCYCPKLKTIIWPTYIDGNKFKDERLWITKHCFSGCTSFDSTNPLSIHMSTENRETGVIRSMVDYNSFYNVPNLEIYCVRNGQKILFTNDEIISMGGKTIIRSGAKKINGLNCLTYEQLINSVLYFTLSSGSLQKESIENALISLNPLAITGNVGSYNIKHLGTELFYHEEALIYAETPVSLPPETDSVEVMGSAVFKDCINLKSVDIRTKLVRLQPYTFYRCRSLADLSMDMSALKYIIYSAFSDCRSLAKGNLISNANALERIASEAFSYCTGFTGSNSLNKLRIPSTVTTIDEGAFLNVPYVVYTGSASGSPWGAVRVASS